MNTKSIGEAVADFIRGQGFEKRLKEADLFRLWPRIVGEVISERSRPVSIERGRLVVHVDDSSWRNELSLMEPEIKDKLNRALGGTVVESIVFR